MMVLRLWRKILTTPRDSTIFRAVHLSGRTTSFAAVQNPSRVFTECGRSHQQTWTQVLLAAAERFNINKPDVFSGELEALVSIQRSSDVGTWSASLATDPHNPVDRFRLIMKPVAAQADGQPVPQVKPVEGSTCWILPRGTSRSDALNVWSPELKNAVYASICICGNRIRNIAATQFLNDCTKPNQFGNPDRLQGWASTLSAPFLQPYWHLPNAALARWMIKARFDQCPTEDYFRTRPQSRLVVRFLDSSDTNVHATCARRLRPIVFDLRL